MAHEWTGGISFHDSIVTGGNFTVVQSASTNAELTLKDNIASGALLKAVERFPAPKCDPDTRLNALAVVKGWIVEGKVINGGEGGSEGASRSEAIMWLSGAPGVGKSAILQTVCEDLAVKDGLIDISHFFGRGQGRREKAIYFPATAAYQLGRSSTTHHSFIMTAIENDPAVFQETMDEQFRKLVVDTVALEEGASLRWKPLTIIIDAVDEVNSVEDQIALLEVVFKAATKNGMRFLIASRPERSIHAFFHRPDVRLHVQHVRLDEETFQTSRDIYIFLVKGFARIRQSRPWCFPSTGLPDDELWPGTAILRRLAAESDAQFIFSHLIIESIEADTFTSPHEQLQSILDHTASDTFSKLDSLYHQILSRCLQGPPSKRDQNKNRLMGILCTIICWPRELSTAGIAGVLGEEKYVIDNIVRGPMRSLFKLKDNNPDSRVALCHKSLRDCVLNPSRAGDFLIASTNPDRSPLDGLYHEILSRCLQGPDSERSRKKTLLMNLLRVIIFWPETLSVASIADALDEEKSTIEKVIRGPIRCLFKLGFMHTVTLWHESFREYVLDQSRCGEFFISNAEPNPTMLDALYQEIMSRCLQGHPSKRDWNKALLLDIIRVIIFWPVRLPVAGIAEVLGEGKAVVEGVIRGPTRSLFKLEGRKVNPGVLLCHETLQSYVLDPSRCGEFLIVSTNLDTFYHQIMCRCLQGTPSERGRNKALLLAILHVIIFWPEGLPVAGIAGVLDEGEAVVENVIQGPMRSLFKVEHGNPSSPVRLCGMSLQDCLLDRSRAGVFFAGSDDPNLSILDGLYFGILSRCHRESTYKGDLNKPLLLDILRVIAFWPTGLPISDIADISGKGEVVVENFIRGPMRQLFELDGANLNPTVTVRYESFRDYILDHDRAGEFFIASDDPSLSIIDALYQGIMSRCLQGTPSERDWNKALLLDIIGVIIFWPVRLPVAGIAEVLGEGKAVVEGVIRGPTRFLFKLERHKINPRVLLCHETLQSYVLDPSRCGEFLIASTNLDTLYHQIMYRCLQGTPSERDRNKALLLEILRIIVFWPTSLSIAGIADVLGEGTAVVKNVIEGPMCFLFMLEDGKFDFRVGLCHETLQSYVLDRRRCREFFIDSADPDVSELDTFYHKLMCRCLQGPPSERDRIKALLLGILRVLICFPKGSSVTDIAYLLGEEESVIEDFIRGPARSLFKSEDPKVKPRVFLCHQTLQEYVLDRSRCSEFSISSTDPQYSLLDGLYHEVMRRCLQDSPSERSHSKALLLGILRALFVWPKALSLTAIAHVLAEEESVVEGFVRGPARSLFKDKYEHPDYTSVVLRHYSLQDCVLDRGRAGEFFISKDEPDELYAEILSRPPPSDAQHSFPPHVLTKVLQCMQAFEHMGARPSVEDVSSTLNIPPNIVRNVLLGPQRSLFRCDRIDGHIQFVADDFGLFLADASLSGHLAIPDSMAAEIVIAKILSIPPPCDLEKSFSRQDLLGVLRVTKIWSSRALPLLSIGSVLRIRSDIVENVVRGPQRHLWKESLGVLRLADPVRQFLSDASRSGEFHVSQGSEDALLLSLLSIPPPTEPDKSYSRDDLRRVLHIVLYFNAPTVADISSVLRIEPRTIQNVICGPHHYFFYQLGDSVSFRPSMDDKYFWDGSRCGEFHFSSADDASLLDPIFRHPTVFAESYSREDLIRVFLAVTLLCGNDTTIAGIAEMLRIGDHVVWDVLNAGPHRILFGTQKVSVSTLRFSTLRTDWLHSDPGQKSCVPMSDIDALLISILSRAQPANPQRSYGRQDLMTVIGALLAFEDLVLDEVVSVTGLATDVVQNIIQGPHRPLFGNGVYLKKYSLHALVRSFFQSSRRSGEYHISRDDTDQLVIQYLSLPPLAPSEVSHSSFRQCLLKVMQFLFVSGLGEREISLVYVASQLDLDLDIVRQVVAGQHEILFKHKWYRNGVVFGVSFSSRVRDIRGFLLDPNRSKKFYVGP